MQRREFRFRPIDFFLLVQFDQKRNNESNNFLLRKRSRSNVFLLWTPFPVRATIGHIDSTFIGRTKRSVWELLLCSNNNTTSSLITEYEPLKFVSMFAFRFQHTDSSHTDSEWRHATKLSAPSSLRCMITTPSYLQEVNSLLLCNHVVCILSDFLQGNFIKW